MSEAQNFAYRMHHISGGNRLGAIGPPLARQSDEFLNWVIAQTPEGSTFSETIVAIALDVWQEEHPNDS